jgi:hypothetical protein
MICPKCETQYYDYVKVCPVCGTPLITEEEFEGNLVHPSDYVIVYTTEAEYEADMLKANLESAGIDVKLLDQKDQNFPAPGDLSVVKVLVKKDDVQDALAIIEDINKHGEKGE